MTRRFDAQPLPRGLLDELLDLARRAPSAGFSQGVYFLVLDGDTLQRFWTETVEQAWREEIAEGIGRCPVVVIPLADAEAYTARYAEADKIAHGLADAAAWPVPYWMTDTAMATQNLLLLAEERGLGALLFGLFRDTAPFLAGLGVPARLQPLGAVAIGVRATDDVASGSSTTHPRRTLAEVVRHNRWSD
jgi:nitroreductase